MPDLGQPDIIQDSISAGVLSQAYQADGMPSVLGDYGDTVRKPEPGVAEQEQISLPCSAVPAPGRTQRRLLILLGVGIGAAGADCRLGAAAVKPVCRSWPPWGSR